MSLANRPDLDFLLGKEKKEAKESRSGLPVSKFISRVKKEHLERQKENYYES